MATVFSIVCFSSYSEESKKLVAHYTFDGDFKDSSGNALDGELTGDVPFTQGILRQSAQFGNGYIEVKDNNLLDFSTEFTASMWVKMSPNVDKANWAGLKTLILKDGNRYNPYTIFLYHSKTCTAEFDGNDYNCSRVDAGKAMELIGEKWYLLTITFKDGKTSIYNDDKFIKAATVKDEDKILNKTEGSLFIGQDALGQWTREFYGCIDDLRLYNYALDVNEIKAIYDEVITSAAGVIKLQIDNPKMTVNDLEKEVDPGRGTTPVVVNNRTLVPIRAVIEAMGGTVAWNGKDSRVDITLKGKTIKLWINKLEAKVGNETKVLEVAPSIIKGRTMIPLRFVTENLGATLEWNGVERKITLRYTP